MNLYGIVTLLFIILLRLLPSLVTLLLCTDITLFKNRRSWILCLVTTGIGILPNFALYCLLHKLLRGRWNFLYTADAILHFDFTYQELDYLPLSMLLCLMFSFVLGLLFRLVLRTALRKSYFHPLSKKVKATLLSSVSVMGCATILLFYVGFTGIQNVVINEVCSYNVSTPVDSNGTVCDYIELFNNGQLDCELYNLYLTDDLSNLTKKSVPDGRIPAQGYLLIRLDDGALAVRKEGEETITLSDSSGNILDQITTEAVTADFSYSRLEDGSSIWEGVSCTPGISNSNGVSKAALTPVFSHESGFYDESFSLSISAGKDCTVYYTLDGSEPGPGSYVYTQPIHVYNKSKEPNVFRNTQNVVTDWRSYTPDPSPVDKAFIIRAIAISNNGIVGDSVSATYFIGLEDYTSQNVISLIADPEDLWGDNGIYVTGKEYDDWYLKGENRDGPSPNFIYHGRDWEIEGSPLPNFYHHGRDEEIGDSPLPNFNYHGRDWEIEAAFAYFSQGRFFDQKIGLRISGASARLVPLKRFSLYARNDYSETRFFEQELIDETFSRRLVLREGTANAVIQAIAENRNVAIQRFTRVAVFLNGEFWYYTNLMEKYDDNYFLQHYGIDPQNIIVCDSGELSEGVHGDVLFWEEVHGFVETHDMSTESSYEQLGQIVDLQSYIDFLCINMYIDNLDFDEFKNFVVWKARTPAPGKYADGKWRFALYDLDAMEWNDASFWGLSTQAEKNSFQLMPRFAVPLSDQGIYLRLIKNPVFRQQFAITFMDLVNNEFAYENVVQEIMSRDGALLSAYYINFFHNRPKYIVPYMAEEFGLTGSLEKLTLQINIPEGGSVQLNTIVPDLSSGSWTGQYYTDYPVTVTAVANDGYEFVGWEGVENTDETTLEVFLKEGGITLNAIFKKTDMP